MRDEKVEHGAPGRVSRPGTRVKTSPPVERDRQQNFADWTLVGLSPDEFREHLVLASATAGLTLPELVLPEAHHVILRGMRFHYLDWGTRGQPPVLFLHGGGLNVHTWDLVCAALRLERHCLALDQRGHGDSEWSPEMDYATESHVADLDAFVDRLGLDRFVLVGMSLGGANALAWAGTHSQRLAALVLVDVGPETRQAGRSEEHTSELQSRLHLVCRLLLEKKKKKQHESTPTHATSQTQ